jgi:hypothetical protein
MGLDAWLRGLPHGAAGLPALDKTLDANGREFPALAAAARRRARPSLIRVRVFDPLSRFALFWGVLTTVLDLTYTAFVVPLSIAFNVSYNVAAYNVMDAIGNSFYLLDVVVQFQVGFIARWDTCRATVLDGPAAARFYVRHGTFFVDVLALLPSVVHYSMVFSEGVDASHAAHAVNLVKLCRLARVFRLLGRMHRPDSGGVLGPEISARLSVMTVVVVDTLLIAALLVNLMGCLWWWCARRRATHHGDRAAAAGRAAVDAPCPTEPHPTQFTPRPRPRRAGSRSSRGSTSRGSAPPRCPSSTCRRPTTGRAGSSASTSRR